ncbi:MAG: flagellar hook-associated protein FlgK [Armatimonadetes bacterium]|nr:MAG: flagellar hook-associated protein FlgK [Armatimonadota bacterium]
MPSAFSGIDIAARALRTFEAALNVTGHNIANVNTRGYARQRLEIGQTLPEQRWTLSGLAMFGTGTFIQGVAQIRDLFLDGRFLEVSSERSKSGTMRDALQAVEQVLGEPASHAISDALNAFFDSWNNLAANPADEAARIDVRIKAATFVSRVRDAHERLMTQDTLLRQQVDATIVRINELGRRIADLNREIRQQMAAGADPNDAMDQRQVALEDLSELVDFRTQRMEDGTVQVFIHNHTLVGQIDAFDLPSGYDPATGTVTDGTRVTQISGGRLSGLFGGLNALTSYRLQLDTFVNELRTQVNNLHVTGINLNNTTGIDFFSGTNGAADLDLSDDVKADAKNIAAGASGAPGDGSVALAIARLREAPLTVLGGRSLATYFADLVGRIGQDSQSFAQKLDIQTTLLNQIEQQRQGVSGVNLDEELSNMVRYQRAFQSAAKVLSVLDQTTEELIRAFGR